MTETISARRAGTTRAQLLARIHCIKKERCWSEDEYRDMLQGVSGQRSAADLDFAGLARAVAVLGGKPVRVTAEARQDAGEWGCIARATDEKKPLLRKIAATCSALAAGRSYAERIAKRQCGGIDRKLEMMSYDELYKVVQALATTLAARQKKAAAAGSVAAEGVPA